MSTHLDVYLDGTLAGRLTQTSGGALTFTYNADYLARPEPTPLSLSMPLAAPRHGNRAVTAWLDGLLPDNPAVRQEWGRRFGVSARNPFALLRVVGRDAAGAVQVLPPDLAPSDAARRSGRVQQLGDDELTRMLEALTLGDRGWEVGAGSGRWSLAGAQHKIALHRLPDGAWAVPLDATPTTHILKPTRAGTRFDDLHINEYVCLAAAARLGLRVADVDLALHGEARVLISTRYDRGQTRSGAWVRLHQEDVLQAMSYRPEQKYQQDGGPSVKEIARFFALIPRRDRAALQSAFFDLLAFNVLVGGTDAHAKNYSVLLRGSRVALAPLYDLASYAPYLRPGELLTSSMKIGTSWHVRDMTADDWGHVGAALGLSHEQAVARVEQFRADLPAALQDAAASAPPAFTSEALRIADAIAGQPHLRPRPLARAPRRRRH